MDEAHRGRFNPLMKCQGVELHDRSAQPVALGHAPARGARLARRLAWCTIALSFAAQAAPPRIEHVSPLAGPQLAVSGRHFGAACAGCEVVADYGAGLRQALLVTSWSDTRIVVRLPDLNAGTAVSLRVVTPAQGSEAVSATVRRERVPERSPGTIVTTVPPELQVFQVASTLKVGNRGDESYDVSQPAPGCARPGLVFDHARIVVGRRRFGEAEIVSMPPAGCTSCPPLRVRWYHEPTGQLEFQVHVVRRRVEGACAHLRR